MDEVMVAMRDGVTLASDVYLPPGRGPHPTILTRTPYDKRARESQIAAYAAAFNERGYALVAQDTRGKHRSQGRPLAFVAEAQDAYDTLEWLSEERWCDRRIGMSGDSYCGFTQWAAVASGHPSLAAIVPANTGARVGEWMYRQGVFELAFAAPWAAGTWIDASQHDVEPWEFDWSVRPLREVIGATMGGSDSASLRRWREAQPEDPFWTSGIYGGRDPLLHGTVPALHMGGWWDLFRYVQAPEWASARATSPAPRWLVMDATDHGLFEFSAQPPGMPDRQWWGGEQSRALMLAWLEPQLEFYDRVLKGSDTPAPLPVRWRLTQAGWHDELTWPPPRAVPLALHLGGDQAGSGDGGSLTPRADRGALWSRWVHDPESLVPSQEKTPFLVLADPPDDVPTGRRPDVLNFTSEPWATDLDLCGPVLAELGLGSSASTMHAVVRLLDAAPQGSTRRICDGAAAAALGGEEGRAFVGLGDVAYRLLAGHRLRVQVCSSDYPRYLPHPGTDESPWDAVRVERNHQRLRVGGERGSRLWLSVLARGERDGR